MQFQGVSHFLEVKYFKIIQIFLDFNFRILDWIFVKRMLFELFEVSGTDQIMASGKLCASFIFTP